MSKVSAFEHTNYENQEYLGTQIYNYIKNGG
jgi:hypothetical protein